MSQATDIETTEAIGGVANIAAEQASESPQPAQQDPLAVLGHNNPPEPVTGAQQPTGQPPTGPPSDIERVRVRVLPDGRLSRRDAALYLGVATKTLAMWQLNGKGPPSVLVGGRRFYFKKILDAYVSGRAMTALVVLLSVGTFLAARMTAAAIVAA